MKTVRVNTLYGSGIYSGKIVHGQACKEYDIENPILVFPNGDVKYYETIVFAARRNKGRLAIILEKGGQNCHTIVTMRERDGIAIIHLPEARKILKSGSNVLVNASAHKIIINKEEIQ